MSDNVIHLQAVETGEGFRIPASNVLEGAMDADLHDVVVLGRGADGTTFIASNIGDGASMLMIEQAKMVVLLGNMEAGE